MRRFHISVNGTAYDVAVEEVSGGEAAAPVAAPLLPAPLRPPAAAPAAPAAKPAVSAGTGAAPRSFLRCPVRSLTSMLRSATP